MFHYFFVVYISHRGIYSAKNKIKTVRVLCSPDFSKVFSIETDASSVAIGVVLTQAGHPLAFFSKKMTPKMQSSFAYI